MMTDPKVVALYHEMRRRDTFERTAEMLWEMLVKAVKDHPDRPRHLFLDIEDHRNRAGGFDHDAFELIGHFIPDMMMTYLTESTNPLGLKLHNDAQRNDIPETLEIRQPQKGEKS